MLILDDWGPDRLNADQRRDLMEIVEDRYQNASILITSQLPIAKWHEVIGKPTYLSADAATFGEPDGDNMDVQLLPDGLLIRFAMTLPTIRLAEGTPAGLVDEMRER